MILIHGVGGTHLNWPPEVRRLRQRCVYALDLPGHGKSSGTGEQSIDEYTERIIDWMHELDLNRAMIVGHGMGGAVALQLTIQSSRLVTGLGLIATGSRLPVPADIVDLLANPASIHTANERLTERSFCSQAPAPMLALYNRRLGELRPSVLQGDFLACEGYDASAKLTEIHKPALVISGDQDRLVPLRYSQLLANRLPWSQFSVVHDAGHMVALEQPRLVSTFIDEFIQEHAQY